MPLITWKDVTDRYPEIVKGSGDATRVNSNHLLHGVAELESRLCDKYTTPFSSNNLTAQDLAIDLTFAKLYRYKDQKKVEQVEKYVDSRIEKLLNGEAAMITNTGEVINSIGGTVFSTTGNYHPVFGVTPVEALVVSSAEIIAEENARGRFY